MRGGPLPPLSSLLLLRLDDDDDDRPYMYIYTCIYMYVCVFLQTAHPPTHPPTHAPTHPPTHPKHRHGHGCNNEALRILTGWVDEPLLNALALAPPVTQAAALRAAKAHVRR